MRVLVRPHTSFIKYWMVCYTKFSIVRYGTKVVGWFKFPSGFQTKILCASFISSTRATCLAHLIHLDLIIIIKSDEDYKLWSCSYAFTSTFIISNIPLSTQLSNNLRVPLLMWETNFQAHMKQNCKGAITKVFFMLHHLGCWCASLTVFTVAS
jgi:hypothetical protein